MGQGTGLGAPASGAPASGARQVGRAFSNAGIAARRRITTSVRRGAENVGKVGKRVGQQLASTAVAMMASNQFSSIEAGPLQRRLTDQGWRLSQIEKLALLPDSTFDSLLPVKELRDDVQEALSEGLYPEYTSSDNQMKAQANVQNIARYVTWLPTDKKEILNPLKEAAFSLSDVILSLFYFSVKLHWVIVTSEPGTANSTVKQVVLAPPDETVALGTLYLYYDASKQHVFLGPKPPHDKTFWDVHHVRKNGVQLKPRRHDCMTTTNWVRFQSQHDHTRAENRYGQALDSFQCALTQGLRELLRFECSDALGVTAKERGSMRVVPNQAIYQAADSKGDASLPPPAEAGSAVGEPDDAGAPREVSRDSSTDAIRAVVLAATVAEKGSGFSDSESDEEPYAQTHRLNPPQNGSRITENPSPPMREIPHPSEESAYAVLASKDQRRLAQRKAEPPTETDADDIRGIPARTSTDIPGAGVEVWDMSDAPEPERVKGDAASTGSTQDANDHSLLLQVPPRVHWAVQLSLLGIAFRQINPSLNSEKARAKRAKDFAWCARFFERQAARRCAHERVPLLGGRSRSGSLSSLSAAVPVM